MLEVMDSISELVYAADPDTYELLYVNDSGKETFSIETVENMKCYEAFQHRDSPCEFCTNKYLSKDKNYTWEFTNPVSGQTYILKDRLVDWNGRLARVEIAFDVTEVSQEKHLLENSLRTQETVMKCVQQLHEAADLEKGIYNMLALLGESLEAERTYIFEIKDDRMYNTYEWCRGEVSVEMENLQDMDTTLIQRWLPAFERKECVIIENLEDLKETSPEEYAILRSQNIERLVAAPVERDGRFFGFIGVDNPPTERLFNIATLLTTLRYFLMTTLLRIENEHRVRQLSYHDTLTGLYNRNRYFQDIEELKNWKTSVGVVYMDLNGLKEINDRDGHAEGDKALVHCGDIMKKALPDAAHYRIGGDEFVAIQKGVGRERFDGQIGEMRKLCGNDSEYQMALGATWSILPDDVEEMVREADERMYDDKRKYYRNQPHFSVKRDPGKMEYLWQEAPLIQEYNMLMSAMRVSVSKHLMRQDMHLLWANDFFYELIGYTKEEFETIYHKNCGKYFSCMEEESNKFGSFVKKSYEQGKSGYQFLLQLPHKNGNRIWVNMVGTFTEEKQDGVPVIYTVLTNVNEMILAQKEQSVTYDNIPGFVAKIRVGKEGLHLLYGNKQFNKFFGEDSKEEQRACLQANIKRNEDSIGGEYAKLRKGESRIIEIEAVGADGKITYFKVSGGCVEWIKNDPVYLVVFIDVTESVEQRKALRTMAYVDSVTKGINRNGFSEVSAPVIGRAKPYEYAFVSLDVQKFKVINDLFGTEAGDMTLRHIYNVLSKNLEEAEFVTRVSADTFNLLLKQKEKVDTEERVCKLVEKINDFNANTEFPYLLVFAAGIYPIDNPSLSITQIRDRANVARKQVKSVTGTQLCACKYYNNDDRLTLSREKEIENRMQDALKKGEFVVYLQPKQNLNNSEVAGAEALVRWKDPKRGLLPPADFIPLFEKNRFIIELDLYVFEQVCKKLRSWKDNGKRLVPISVNMSRAHLSDSNFLERYEKIRKHYDIPAQLLEIEVTETLIFENPELLATVIDDIKALGYRCSMDDFGSGYSSLNVLKNIRVDTLKLDRAFFSEKLVNGSRETDIISIVIEMARKLQMTTVAEGVETEAQAEFLKSVGCDILQGFLFSRPISMDQFEEMIYKDNN